MKLIKRIEIPNDTYNTILCIDKFQDAEKTIYNISIKNNIYQIPAGFINRLKYIYNIFRRKDIVYAELNNIDEHKIKNLVPELLDLINS